MKKILATVLCLGIISTPCFAYGRHDYYRPAPPHRIEPPRIHRYYQPAPPPPRAHYYTHSNHRVATTVAVTAGVIGVAALIGALAD